MNKPSILVVDDEPDNFDVIEALLTAQGYELHYASSGEEAIATLDAFQPDLILLDVMMPGIDGIEICRQIKAIPKWQIVPIIMATALSGKEDLSRCLQAGADDFISKPMNGVELRARVHSMLRIKQQYDRIESFSALQRNTIEVLRGNLQELRGNLAASLPHELNTPLNGVLVAMRLLIESDDMDTESIRELVGISYRSACRLESLTQRFLNYFDLELAGASLEQGFEDAKLESAKLESAKLAVDLISSSNLIEYCANSIAEQAERSDDLVCQIENTELAVSCKHLQWIINELLDNAFKFSEPETPVTVRGECQDHLFHLWISDRGRGMTPEQIDHIDAFMQFERRTYEQQGAGLGLKIAQKAVESYGGGFTVTSVYHQETTVYLTLPLEISQQGAESPKTLVANQAESNLSMNSLESTSKKY